MTVLLHVGYLETIIVDKLVFMKNEYSKKSENEFSAGQMEIMSARKCCPGCNRRSWKITLLMMIENNIISSREYALSGEYERNGYFTIKLFAPIYAALSNDDRRQVTLMGRRIFSNCRC